MTNPPDDLRDLDEEHAKALSAGSGHYMAYVGPPSQYDLMGASQFALLVTLGLRGTHRVLDFGCGSLRLGRLLIPYLAQGNYTGLDPNGWLIEDALDRQLGRDIVRIKAPRFFTHADFRADRCGNNFDFIIAQSIFSHTGIDLLTTALTSFETVLANSGLVLLTVLHPGQDGAQEFFGQGWVYPASVAHAPGTVGRAISQANFPYYRVLPWFHPRQTWYALAKEQSRVPGPQYDRFLSGAILDEPAWQASIRQP